MLGKTDNIAFIYVLTNTYNKSVIHEEPIDNYGESMTRSCGTLKLFALRVQRDGD